MMKIIHFIINYAHTNGPKLGKLLKTIKYKELNF